LARFFSAGESLDYQSNIELMSVLPESYCLARRHNFHWEAKILSVLDETSDEGEKVKK
jgi:hypothetical protein